MNRWIKLAATIFALGLTAPAHAQAPNAWVQAWPQTDFSTALVDLSEIESGGPPKDGIPAIDAPTFYPASQETALKPHEPVVSVALNGEARAYPIRYLMWHEIVNDTFGDTPVSVTYCPLCNAAVAFDGRLEDNALTFGVSGMLRYSDMIMYDRNTESWWQQFTGEAVVGKLRGKKLRALPSKLQSWEAFVDQYGPNAAVMREPQGYSRAYGSNPYVGYDTLRKPWLYSGAPPSSGLPMMARIVRVEDRAWPMSRVVDAGSLTEKGIKLSWREGQASALDTRSVANGREVGNIEVHDATTGEPLAHEVTFAFVFQAFEPDGEWMMGTP